MNRIAFSVLIASSLLLSACREEDEEKDKVELALDRALADATALQTVAESACPGPVAGCAADLAREAVAQGGLDQSLALPALAAAGRINEALAVIEAMPIVERFDGVASAIDGMTNSGDWSGLTKLMGTITTPDERMMLFSLALIGQIDLRDQAERKAAYTSLDALKVDMLGYSETVLLGYAVLGDADGGMRAIHTLPEDKDKVRALKLFVEMLEDTGHSADARKVAENARTLQSGVGWVSRLASGTGAIARSTVRKSGEVVVSSGRFVSSASARGWHLATDWARSDGTTPTLAEVESMPAIKRMDGYEAILSDSSNAQAKNAWGDAALAALDFALGQDGADRDAALARAVPMLVRAGYAKQALNAARQIELFSVRAETSARMALDLTARN